MAIPVKKTSGLYAAIGYLLCFIMTATILLTDKNLQTDFGSVSPFFLHWYGLLITAAVDIIAMGVLVLKSSRRVLQVSAIGSLLLAIFLVGDVFTYSSVGFSSLQQFATYLFGVTAYQGNTQYIPGLYDVLLALYVITFGISLGSLRRSSQAK